MHQDIKDYNNSQSSSDREICELLGTEITKNLAMQRIKYGMLTPYGFWMEIQLLDIAK